MIINGGSRSNGGFFAGHLMRADENERVTVKDMRGFAYAQDVPEAFREMREVASGTSCKNFFYHANINTRADERLTPEQWAQAVDALERDLHLDGQPRFVVEHEKEGRVHCHVVWSRIDPDTMTAVPDSHNYRTHEDVSRELEQAFGLQPVERCLTRDKAEMPRQERRPADWESFRAAESGIDPKAVKAELTDLWQRSDSGSAFAAALEERGYILARGDRRDYCVVDPAGDEHSLSRRISGVKAAEIRARMADVDRDALPSVEEARQIARAQPEEPADTTADARQVLGDQPTPAEPSPPTSLFEAILLEATQEAEAASARETAEEAAGQWQRFSGWLSTMREHVAGFGQSVRDYWNNHFGGDRVDEPEPAEASSYETPGTTVTAAELHYETPQQTGPDLTP